MSLVDLKNVEEQTGYDLLPDGFYNLYVDEAYVQDTKAGTGQYIKTTFRVADGKFKDRKIWHNFTIKNPNEKAVEIGLGQLKSMLRAAGKETDALESTEKLYGLKVTAKIKTKKDETYGDSNVISFFKEKSESVGPQTETDDTDIPF